MKIKSDNSTNMWRKKKVNMIDNRRNQWLGVQGVRYNDGVQNRCGLGFL
jgi:hypothetical protein